MGNNMILSSPQFWWWGLYVLHHKLREISKGQSAQEWRTIGGNSQSALRWEEHDQSGDDTCCTRLEYFPVLMIINDCI